MRSREEKDDEIDIPISKTTRPRMYEIVQEMIVRKEISSDDWDFERKNLTRRDPKAMPAAVLAEFMDMLPAEMRMEIMQGSSGRRSTKVRKTTAQAGNSDSAC